jgi:hypothetical protein
MREFDRLPAELRSWLASAILPWNPGSAQRAYAKALQQSQDTDGALRQLDQMQRRLIAKDARAIWGDDHPSAGPDALV